MSSFICADCDTYWIDYGKEGYKMINGNGCKSCEEWKEEVKRSMKKMEKPQVAGCSVDVAVMQNCDAQALYNERRDLSKKDKYLNPAESKQGKLPYDMLSYGMIKDLYSNQIPEALSEIRRNLIKFWERRDFGEELQSHICYNVGSLLADTDVYEELAKVAQVSIEKGYERFNWRKKNSKTYFSSYLLAAALRHMRKAELGEELNKEYKQDGTPCETVPTHKACAAYNLLMICQLIEDGRTDLDDRFKLDIEEK